jgi:hypothetical protein
MRVSLSIQVTVVKKESMLNDDYGSLGKIQDITAMQIGSF